MNRSRRTSRAADERTERRTPPPRDTAAVSQILLGEYEALKAEQSARIAARDNLMYATLAALAATTAAIVSTAARQELVLLLPPVCIVLGWTYLVNDEKISAIGRYLRTDLRPALAAAAGADIAEVLRWETAHREEHRSSVGKHLQLAVDLLMFVVPALVAVTVHWVTGPAHTAPLVASAAELAAAAVLAVRITLAADLSSEGTV
ncbi:hypothetical protein ACIP88_19845 [Streptomyces uncialis]|uniref:hypothetical protein n=1 Tax=Streptomyces uncialis TaxID=1048205 RepID=UPI00380ADBD0